MNAYGIEETSWVLYERVNLRTGLFGRRPRPLARPLANQEKGHRAAHLEPEGEDSRMAVSLEAASWRNGRSSRALIPMAIARTRRVPSP